MKWLITLTLVFSAPAMAAPKAEDIAAYQALTALDARVTTIGYRLAAANAPFCETRYRNPGWVLHSYRQYPDREMAQQAFRFPTPLAIAALVEGGPAARAGLKVGDGLANMPEGLWIGGELVRHKPSAELVDTVNGRMRELFLANTPVELKWQRGSKPPFDELTVTLDPPAICMSDFWVDARSKPDAGADGQRVRITSAFVEFAKSDAELAAILAHELSHNLLDHRARLKSVRKGKTKAILETEVEADRLSVWLMTNAGYDPNAALSIYERYGRKFGLGIFSAGTHHRWKKRVEILKAEIELVNNSDAKDGLREPPLLAASRNQQ